MGKRLGWSLVFRGKTWYLKHRINPDKRQVLVTTGEHNKEKALAAAIKLVNEARSNTAAAINSEDPALAMDLIRKGIIEVQDSDANLISDAEEELLLGLEKDKTNPRLDSLWTFAESSPNDTGLLVNYYKDPSLHSPNIFANKRPVIRKLFGHLKAQSVNRIGEATPQHLESFYGSLKSHYQFGSLQAMDIHVRNMYNLLKKHYGITMVYPKLERPKDMPIHPVTPNDVLSYEDDPKIIEYLLQYASKSSNYAPYRVFVLGINTGMRKTEMAHLTWGNVYLDNRTITVTANQEDTGRGIARSYLKTKRSNRIVPIRTCLLPYLEEWKKQDEDYPYVIPGVANRNKYQNTHLDKAIRTKVCARWYLHVLRHTFVSRAIHDGKIPPATVALWVGDSVDMILSTYSHFVLNEDVNNW